MTFRFIYQPSEYSRIIPAVLIDARASIPAIKNQIGSAIKAYCDAEVVMVSGAPFNTVLFFKIEATDGSLGGYFSLRVTPLGARLRQFQLRPAFVQFNSQISMEIANFITSNQYMKYVL